MALKGDYYIYGAKDPDVQGRYVLYECFGNLDIPIATGKRSVIRREVARLVRPARKSMRRFKK